MRLSWALERSAASGEGDLTTSSSGSLDSFAGAPTPRPEEAPDNPWRRRRPRRHPPPAAPPPAFLAAVDRVAAAADAGAGLPPAPAAATTRRLLAGHHLWLNPQYIRLERLLGEGLLAQVWPDGWADDAPVVGGPWGIAALDAGEPRPLAAPRDTHLVRARHLAGQPELFVALVRGHDLWAMVFWAGAGAALNPAGCLAPRLQLRLPMRHVWDVALDAPAGGRAVELVVFSRHWLGPRRVTRYRLESD